MIIPVRNLQYEMRPCVGAVQIKKLKDSAIIPTIFIHFLLVTVNKIYYTITMFCLQMNDNRQEGMYGRGTDADKRTDS